MKMIVALFGIAFITSLFAEDIYQPIELKVASPEYAPVAKSETFKLKNELNYKIHEQPTPDRGVASEETITEDPTWRNPSSVDEMPLHLRMKESEKLEKWYYEED